MQQIENAYNLIDENREVPSLPYRYNPRAYQADLIDEFFDMLEGLSTVKNFVVCWHRRAGKDVSFFQCVVAAAEIEPGDYYYLLPKQNQARRVVWNGIVMDSDGKPCQFKDFIPPDSLVTANGQEMRYTLANGSNIYVGGSDNFNNFVGGNAKGIVYSEWSLCNPLARDYFKPMINQNNGWQMFCFTPRGKNHAYQTFVNAQKESAQGRWFVSMKDVTQTAKEDGSPVVTQEQIENDIADGMDKDTANQEYYLDFDAAVKGVIYGQEMKKARAEGRIYDCELLKDVPVLTFWDIGLSKGNATTCWLMQPVPDSTKLRLIGYYEAEDEPFDTAEEWLKQFCTKHGVKLGKFYFPHDGKNREWVAGKKRHEEVIARGYDVTVLPRITDVWLGIRQTKSIFDRFEFHEEYCGYGIGCLERYRRKVHDETQVLGEPIHDDSSNGADALRQIGQFYADKHVDNRHDREVQQRNATKLRRSRQDYNPFDNQQQAAPKPYNPFK